MTDYENVKLTKEEIIKVHPELIKYSDNDLESLIELIWQYSIITFKTFNKKNG